jgi:hypothetical protein
MSIVINHVGPTQQPQKTKVYTNKTIEPHFNLYGQNDSFSNNNSCLRRITTKCTRNCITCAAYKENPHGRVTNTMTGARFLAGHDTTTPICNTTNVVYCISCTKCNISYVGETCRSLKTRFLEHRRNIINKSHKSHLVDHFNQDGHDTTHLKLQILTNIVHSGSENKNSLTNLELEWIRILSTAYPFGMNESIKGYGNATKRCQMNTTKVQPYLFYKFARKQNKNHTHNSKRHTKRSEFSFLETSQELTNLSENSEFSTIFRKMKNLKNKNLETIMLHSNNKTFNRKTSHIVYCCYIGLKNKTDANTVDKSKNHVNITIPFINKAQDKLNSSAIFNNSKVRNIIKNHNIENVPKVRIVYKYNDPYSRKLFNYNKHLRHMNTISLTNNQKQDCICKKYPDMIYKPSGHIISGNLQTVNHEMNQIINYGTKHKFNKEINYETLRGFYKDASTAFATKLKGLYKFDDITKESISNSVMDSFERFSDRFFRVTTLQELSSNEPHIEKNLLNGFIITPVDKAGSNYSFCCEKHYYKIMMDELGISLQNGRILCLGNETYKPIANTEAQIINKHTEKLRNFNLAQKEENNTLPLIYAIPKMHKSPYKFRFISGAKKSSAKQLSVVLLNALKLIRTHFHNYCNMIKTRTGKTLCWSINNNTNLLEFLQNGNHNNKNMLSYDFSTLFTKLPHNVIISNMVELISKMFTNSKKTFMHVSINDKYGSTFYSDNEKCYNNHISIRCVELLDLLEFVVKESYVKFADFIFHQLQGVPQGGNASSLIADLTLSMIEFRHLKDATNIPRDSATFRYVDDLAIINFDLQPGIYPPELNLTTEAQNSKGEINYLDLTITLPSGNIKLYNKTDYFNFHVITSMHHDCAISKNTSTGILTSQMIRFARINSDCVDFFNSIKRLIDSYTNNGHLKPLLDQTIKSFCHKYIHTLYRYDLFHNKKAYINIMKHIN